MAIYHYHREIGKRGEGKNSVLAAAYIRGEKKTCERNGDTKDFTSKEDVIYKNCYLPEEAPQWASDLRARTVVDLNGQKQEDVSGELFSTYAWNQVEFSEKRVDSQVYFHDDIALPNSLNQEQAIELVDDFVKNSLAIDGLFCDVAIHWDEGNHHFHVLMPHRRLTDTGFSQKIRRSQASLSQEVIRVRKAWAEVANQKLKTLGFDERIDHRSYKDRGIDLKPTVKVGKFTHVPDQTLALKKAYENEHIIKSNAAAIQQNPSILAEKILQEKPFFDSITLSQELKKHAALHAQVESNYNENPKDIDSTDPILKRLLHDIQTKEGIFNDKALKKNLLEQVSSEEEFQRIYEKIIAHEQVLALGLGEDGRQHFVGRKAFDLENDLLKSTHYLAKRTAFNVSSHLVKQVSSQYGLNASQQRALLHLTRSGDAALVCGYAGTGKTYLLKAAKDVWEQSGFKVLGLATSGKAASGLEAETGISSRTICSFLLAIKHQAISLDDKTVVVVDEMGMVSLDDMSETMAQVRLSCAKFAGVGDVEQTQPVGRGAPQRAMVDEIGAVALDEIIRQKSDWQREATLLFETNQTAQGFDLYQSHGCVHLHETQAIAAQNLIDQWYANYSVAQDKNLMHSIIVAFKNETVDALNLLARETCLTQGLIEEGVLVTTDKGSKHIGVGERLVFTKNDSKTGLCNGDFGTVRSVSKDGKKLEVALDKGAVISFSPEQYTHFTYGYAATVHKTQGQTVKDCFALIDGEGWDRHKFLVAATRHQLSLNIHASNEHFVDLAHLKSSVSRHGLNDILTDFPVAFAARRGFDLRVSASLASSVIQKTKAKVFDALAYLFTHQEAIEQGQSAYDLSHAEIKARRTDAILVAEFCDNRAEMASIFNAMSPLEDEEKQALQQRLTALQCRNGVLAALIKANPAQFSLALERNRITAPQIDSSYVFHENRQFVKALVKAHQLSESISPKDALHLIQHMKTHYGHLCDTLGDKAARNHFLNALEQGADVARRESALEAFGIENRALVNAVARYKSLDHEVSSRLKTRTQDGDADKKELYLAGINRDKLAFELTSNALVEAMSTHFAIKPERLAQHTAKHQDRLFVKAFAALKASTQTQGNLVKQAAAHRIKTEPKRYGIYIDEHLKEGWKSVNLENWLYERRKTIAHSSPELKRSIQQVRRYKVAASCAYVQWQKAIARCKKESPHKNKGFKQAQGLSWKRSLLAHELMGHINQHVAALSMEKVDTTKLYQQALQVDYLNKYRTQTRDTLKAHMAKHINANLKAFQAGLAVYGLYEDVKERAAHSAYLQRIKDAPDKEMKTLIRLALDYQDKKIEAGIVWGQVKALKQLNIDSRGLALQAKQLILQRNSAAHHLLDACTNKEWFTKEVTGINLDLAKLQREAAQHLAQKTLMCYLSAEPVDRCELAKALLANKAGYHLLFDNNISFEVLKKEARDFEQTGRIVPVTSNTSLLSEEKTPPARWDVDRISQALMNNPEETYTAFLGEPKERTPSHLRYSGGLIVSTRGGDAGKWYSFTEEVGGGPLSAIQKYLHYSFPQALAYGASLAGLSDYEAKITTPRPLSLRQESKPADTQAEQKLKNGVLCAQSIWNGTTAADGSLAKRYFIEHRGLDSIDGMAIRYWPKGAVWVDFDAEGLCVEKPNKIPAAVIAARNAEGEVVSVQRIYLDEKTAGKNTFLKEAKLTKGSNKGAPGVIQTGSPGGVLYIAEGPETAASIASLDKEATVLVSFSVSNLSNVGDVIKTYAPKQVFIAADNDGEAAASRKTTEKACQALREQGIDVRIIYPSLLANRVKTDWNDVLIEQGKDALSLMFQEKIEQTKCLYEQGVPATGTLAENYFKTQGKTMDLNEVRFLPSIDFKGQSVPALMLPKTNAQGLLCGQAVFALSEDGTQLIGEGKSKIVTDEGFYMANRGHGEVLIIANTPGDAKAMVKDNSRATVVLSRLDEYHRLCDYLNVQGITPSKVLVLSNTLDRDQQMRVASSCQRFHAQGASLFLKDTSDGSSMKLDFAALEKSRLKMSFEKLLSQMPTETETQAPLTGQERFDALKKEHPLLVQYEQYSRDRKEAQGYKREEIDKKLLVLAKELACDKKIMSILARDIPQVAMDIKKRIQAAQERDRGVRR